MVSYPGDTIFGGEDSLKTDDMFRFDDFFRDTFGKITGIDEAGRGSLAGPVVAAAVILENSSIPVRDSKELNFSEREDIFQQIVSTSKVGGLLKISATGKLIRSLTVRTSDCQGKAVV